MRLKLLASLFVFLSSMVLFTSCIVQSSNPYYTKDIASSVPESIHGIWLIHGNKSKTIKKAKAGDMKNHWIIKKDRFRTYDRKGNIGDLKVKFFSVNGVTYCNTTAASPPDDTNNAYWMMHIRPLHMLSQVTISDDRIEFRTLDPKRVVELARQSGLAMPFTDKKTPLFHAKPSVWIKFLQQYGADKTLFNKEPAVVLIRKK